MRIFTSITLPLMKPALVTSSIFAFIWSWNDFFGPLLYLKSPETLSMASSRSPLVASFESPL